METATNVKQNRLSRLITKAFTKTTLSLAMLFVGLGVVIILSVAQFAFDFEHFNFSQWLSNSLLLTGILIIFMVIGESFKNTIMERPNAMYQITLKEYRLMRTSINDLTVYFTDYHTDYREKTLKDKKINLITNYGIGQAREIVENLKLSQIELLDTQPMEVNGIEFLTITKDQKEFVLKTLKDTRIGFTSPVYYLSEYSSYGAITDQDLPEIIYRKKKAYRWGGRIIRVVLGLSFSFLFAAITANDFMNAGDYQSWYNLLSRIFTAISGLATGYGIAYGIVAFDIQELAIKTNFLQVFKRAIELQTWTPMNRHEKFLKQKAKFEEEEKQKQAEQEVLTEEQFNQYQQMKNNEPIQIEEKPIIKL